MKIVDYDPTQGMAFQGDVAIVPIPAGITIATNDEIRPVAGRLIIQEGEASGHHHAIALPRARNFRDDRRTLGDPGVMTKSPRLGRSLGGAKPAAAEPTARLYQDQQAVTRLQAHGVITRADLAIGCLVVERGPVVVSHEEHDGLRLPIGRYYVGRQVESAGADERKVVD